MEAYLTSNATYMYINLKELEIYLPNNGIISRLIDDNSEIDLGELVLKLRKNKYGDVFEWNENHICLELSRNSFDYLKRDGFYRLNGDDLPNETAKYLYIVVKNINGDT